MATNFDVLQLQFGNLLQKLQNTNSYQVVTNFQRLTRMLKAILKFHERTNSMKKKDIIEFYKTREQAHW